MQAFLLQISYFINIKQLDHAESINLFKRNQVILYFQRRVEVKWFVRYYIYPELQITTGNYKLLAVIQMSKEGAVTLCNYHYHLQLL